VPRFGVGRFLATRKRKVLKVFLPLHHLIKYLFDQILARKYVQKKALVILVWVNNILMGQFHCLIFFLASESEVAGKDMVILGPKKGLLPLHHPINSLIYFIFA
jgi:hypothetical protein